MSAHDETSNARTVRKKDDVDAALEETLATARDADVDDRVVELLRECQQYRLAGDLE